MGKAIGSYIESMVRSNETIYQKYIKRILDVVLAFVALFVLSPVIGFTALAVRIKLGSPVLFKQARPGRGERIFYLYKFKSMTNAMDKNGMLLPDSRRLTKFGGFLRASSLDELPELVNIIKGDMSIVGPRPLSIYYLPHYSKESRMRHCVRPGLTGLAQVNGRNNLNWDERFTFDVKYVQQVTFLGDVKIVLDTVKKVLKSEDVTVRGANAVKDFGPYCILEEEGIMIEKVSGMTYSEIGSYFWLDESEKTSTSKLVTWLPKVSDSTFTFSGRASIEVALRDIMNHRHAKKVYVPSYCCISMLQSFIDHGLKIQYYDVTLKKGVFIYDIDYHHDCDIILIMNYFGIDVEQTQDMIEKLHNGRAVIIEDVTHSLMNDTVFSSYSDYLVASLRKWFAVPTGGWLGKVSGKLTVKPNLSGNHTVDEKIQGMREKKAYISGKITDKKHFLMTNAKFENDLIHVDRMLMLDDLSYGILCGMDVDRIRQQRRRNAEKLFSGLKDLDGEILTLPRLNLERDTPLFVPVFLKEKERDSLRKYLIDHGVYCPIHWPEIMGAAVGIRANELSLICDQRYSENDMKVVVNYIKEWAAMNKTI